MGICTTKNDGDRNSRNGFSQGQSPDFWKQFEIETPNLLCTQSYDIKNVCISRACGAISLFCQNPNCPACPKIHPHCGSMKLEVITRMLQKRGEHLRQMIAKMQEIEVRTFQSIQNRRAYLLQDFYMKGFEKNYGEIIESVYFGKKTISMNGDMAEDFYVRLKESNSKLPKIESEMIKFFKREIERISAPAIKLQEDVLEQYLSRAKVMAKETQQKIQLSLSQLAQTNFKSKILPDKYSDEVKFIEESLDFPRKIKHIFTGSEHGFKASHFHQICDNVPHTLVLLETEFGKIIGGYTPLTWNCTKGFASDQECTGFLFSVNLKQKFTLTRPQKAIQCHPDYGPVFGSGADLAISDECHKNFDSCLNFPYCYNYKDGYKFGQDTWTKICGAKQGKTFRIKEYEVFEVIW